MLACLTRTYDVEGWARVAAVGAARACAFRVGRLEGQTIISHPGGRSCAERVAAVRASSAGLGGLRFEAERSRARRSSLSGGLSWAERLTLHCDATADRPSRGRPAVAHDAARESWA